LGELIEVDGQRKELIINVEKGRKTRKHRRKVEFSSLKNYAGSLTILKGIGVELSKRLTLKFASRKSQIKFLNEDL